MKKRRSRAKEAVSDDFFSDRLILHFAGRGLPLEGFTRLSLRYSDSIGNRTVKDNGGGYYSYTVSSSSITQQPGNWPSLTIPGFSTSSSFLLIAVLIAGLLSFPVVLITRREKNEQAQSPSLVGRRV